MPSEETDQLLSQPQPGRLSGLLPVGVFLVLFIGSGAILHDFYAMPAIVAFLQSRKRSFEEKLETAASGAEAVTAP